jgi:HK97 gp10 family phage protein
MEIKTEKNAVIGQIRSSAPYSKHLEFGTVNIMPRPFMQPALEKNKAKIKRKFNQGILDK